jgi:hypothetical protein
VASHLKLTEYFVVRACRLFKTAVEKNFLQVTTTATITPHNTTITITMT